MKASESVGHQIVYLDYVLESAPTEMDAELLRPVWNNLRYLLSDPATPGEIRQLAAETEALVTRWMQAGRTLTRESLERIRAALESVLKALKQTSGPSPAGAV